MNTAEIKRMPYSPVLVIGGGLAGMYAAIAAEETGAAATILCKSRTGGSGNSIQQTGFISST